MRRTSAAILVLCVTLSAVPFSGARSSEEDRFWADREADLHALLTSPVPDDKAAAILAARAGATVTSEMYLDAARAALALEEGADAFAPELVRAALAAEVRASAAATTNDAARILAQREDGTLTPESLAAVGLSSIGVAQNAPLLAGLARVDATRIEALARALDEPRTTWEQGTWDTYGLTLEVVYLLVAMQDGDLAAWILPHDIRTFTTYSAVRVIGPIQEGNTNNGRIWTQLYVDILVGIAMDNHGFADALLLQLPVSAYVEINWRCTTYLFGTCIVWSFGSVGGSGDTLIARDATYTFAYPANGGQFPTRVTGQDILQSVYDRLGVLPHAAPSDYAFRSQLEGTPSIADLSTQAPAVTYYGLQVSPELAPLGDVVKHVRVHPPAPVLTHTVAEVPTTVSVDGYNIGPTAGYAATEVRAFELTWLIVRWHNVGVEETGVLPSSPATFYYDVPSGQYKLTDARVDAYGGVIVSDWQLSGDLPTVNAPPAPVTI